MKGYIAITSKQKISTGEILYTYAVIDYANLSVVRYASVDEYNVGMVTRGYDVQPINFSFDYNNGKICETHGNLDRLTPREGIQPMIVVQELATSVGTIVGYRLLNPVSLQVFAVKKEDILIRQQKSNIPLLQNGIIRGNKINCYKDCKFPRFIIGTKTRSAVKKPKNLSNKLSTGNVDTQNKDNILSKFSPAQRREISMAKSDGVDIRLLLNPELSPEQMRVIWVSKKRGVYSEYFAKPEYSVDVMKFYADKLLTQKIVKECADLLSRPSYGVDKLTELYLSVCEGVDYSSYIDADSAEKMYVERKKLSTQLWGKSSSIHNIEGDIINKSSKFAQKVKKGLV